MKIKKTKLNPKISVNPFYLVRGISKVKKYVIIEAPFEIIDDLFTRSFKKTDKFPFYKDDVCYLGSGSCVSGESFPDCGFIVRNKLVNKFVNWVSKQYNINEIKKGE